MLRRAQERTFRDRRQVNTMKHNENYQHIARQLMRKRLAELDARAADNKGGVLTVEESTELGQLQELLAQTWRDCPDCLGVGRVRFAYTAFVGVGGYMIARADEDQAGYTPQDAFGAFSSYEAAKARANDLNKDLGLSFQEAYKIVTSSMRADNIRQRNSQKQSA
jgi:hypothetical protein